LGLARCGTSPKQLTATQVQGISLTLYVYQLRKDANGVENVAVEKVTYTKSVEPTGGS